MTRGQPAVWQEAVGRQRRAGGGSAGEHMDDAWAVGGGRMDAWDDARAAGGEPAAARADACERPATLLDSGGPPRTATDARAVPGESSVMARGGLYLSAATTCL